MTCIVAINDTKNNIIYMGSDSCGSNGFTYTTQHQEKVFPVNDKFLIGSAGSCRGHDILQCSIEPDEQKENESIEKYMKTTFIDHIRYKFKFKGHTNIDNNNEYNENNFLVGYKNTLYKIQGNFALLPCAPWGVSIGSGTYAANAVLWTLKDEKLTPKEKIMKALLAAEATVVTVKGPMNITEMKYE